MRALGRRRGAGDVRHVVPDFVGEIAVLQAVGNDDLRPGVEVGVEVPEDLNAALRVADDVQDGRAASFDGPFVADTSGETDRTCTTDPTKYPPPFDLPYHG